MRRDSERVIVNGFDESRVAGNHGRPNVSTIVDGAEYRYLPALEKLTGAWRKMIGDSFADVLRDIADAGPFLNRNFSPVKSHRFLWRRGSSEVVVRLHLQLDEAGRPTIAITEVAHFAEFRIAVVVRVIRTDPMATLAVERDREISAGGEIAGHRIAVCRDFARVDDIESVVRRVGRILHEE